MTRIPERDESVDRLLRAVHTRGHADDVLAAGRSCPDASELAAWADGDLSAEIAAKMDAHIATCASCQSVVAAFARTDAPAVILPFWRRPAVVIPALSIAAAAAAVLAMAVWSRPSSRVAPVTTVADATLPAAGVPEPAPVVEPPATSTLDARTSARAPRSRQAAASGAPAAPRRADRAQADMATPSHDAAKPATPPDDFTSDRAARAAQASAKATSGAPAPPPPPAIVAQPPAGATARDPWQIINMAPGMTLSGVNVGGSASGQQLTVNAFGSSGNVQWNLEGGNIADLGTVVAEFSFGPASVAPGGSGGGGRAGGRAGGGASAAASRTVAADNARPLTPARWRILGDGHVDRSTDAGATWMRMSADPSLYFTAGVASGPTICWLAGRAGVVMETTDNEHFTRVDLPDRVDIKTLIAFGRDSAEVVTTTGVTYSTTDGGRTWQRRQ